MKYSITRRDFDGSILDSAACQRRDRAQFLLACAVYDMAETQALRDTRAAWRAKDHGDIPIVGASERRIELGSQSVTLSIGA